MPAIATARAAKLDNRRVLMVGTDMAVGKMTAGLELYRVLAKRGADAPFSPPGGRNLDHGTGIRLMRSGSTMPPAPSSAWSGSRRPRIVIVEGQGSLLHPGSTATLPLMRGSCTNAMILCHRASMTHLDTSDEIEIPPLRDVVALNEMTASANGALIEAKVIGVALNTSRLDESAAMEAIARTQGETACLSPTRCVLARISWRTRLSKRLIAGNRCSGTDERKCGG